jgi:phosphatidylglycerol:prolipoprotein diacylglycerol transferase
LTSGFHPDASGTISPFEKAKQQMLAVTYWFEPTPAPAEPYTVKVRFTGRRTDVEGKTQGGDRFTHDEVLPGIIPGSGPISVTAKIRDINPGTWEVSARILDPSQSEHSTHRSHRRASRALAATSTFGSPLTPEAPDRVDTWFWRRWAPSVDWNQEIRTGLEAFVRVPGAFPFIWITFVGLGMIVALVTQTLLLAHAHLHIGPVWAWTLVAIAVGTAGAKIWFIVKHRGERRFEGWCIQGFIAGAAPAAFIIFTAFHFPTGAVLDASAPGLMFGMAVGRIGCFLGGCCVGMPTSASWGIWCSDQHVGARRIPTQLMESASALVLGLALLLPFLARGPAGGAYFVAALAAYTLLREGLLRLRAEPLKVRGPVISIAAAAVLLTSMVFIVI